ncbi:MAG: Nucleoside-diphosphate-sugar pyrophosphorylase family protein [Bryobacterales bacterium]|nr:Nucleoside-diphosphate-sugar pyrophosphorylase family protein [Bryobacterales bacterium]
MNKVLLMPTAKLVGPDLRSEFGPIPSAMIPLDSRPAMQYVAEPYLSRGFKLVLAVDEKQEMVREYVERHPQLGAQLISLKNSTSLGATVLGALDALGYDPDQLVINFADTFVGDEMLGEDTVCYTEADEVYRWTTFQIDFGNKLTCVVDKNKDNPYGTLLPVFVGVFSISDVKSFRELLRQVISSRSGEIDPFYGAIVEYFNGLPVERRNLQHVQDWRDFGHLDTYYQAKRAFCINKRFFNCVEIDDRRGIVRKSSTNAEKLLNEMKWYMELPKALRYMAPRVFDYSFAKAEPFMEMEYYSYPALNDVYLYGSLDPGIWKRVFQAIGNVLRQMHSHRFQPDEPGQLARCMKTMYEEKTAARLQPILDDPRFARFSEHWVNINGETHMGVRQCLDVLPQVAAAVDMYSLDYFTVIHGDLCLSNILYDRRNSFVRVIDPRGEFGDVGIFGDMRYDLAKLSHSLEGDYDFMVNGMFDSQWTAGGFRYQPQLDERHRTVKKLFHSWFMTEFGESYLQIKLIESLLFLSMVPLHADRFEAQQAFLARGIEAFNSVAGKVLPREEMAIA